MDVKKIQRNIENIEEALRQANFTVSRKVGDFKYSFMTGATYTHYILYVDDIKKKWLMTSPFLSEVEKILDYNDLLDYGFFDEDGRDIMGKVRSGTIGFMGAVGSAAVGGMLDGSVSLGGLAGGMGGSRISKILPGEKGASAAYGFVVRTKDSDVNNPVLIFDFVDAFLRHMKQSDGTFDKVIGKFAVGAMQTMQGRNRNEKPYKNDIAAIQEMAGVFDYILASNA